MTTIMPIPAGGIPWLRFGLPGGKIHLATTTLLDSYGLRRRPVDLASTEAETEMRWRRLFSV